MRRLVYPLWCIDARKKVEWFKSYLNQDDRILEIGSGMGSVVAELRNRGYQVNAVDIQDTSIKPDLMPDIYSGDHLPYADEAFDVCLLLTVLHHCPDPDKVLFEAARVGQLVIVVEDIYVTRWQKKLTHWLDSLLNWEFHGHPHSNRNDKQWRNSFKELDLQVIYASKQRVARVFCQVTYVLSVNRSGDST